MILGHKIKLFQKDLSMNSFTEVFE